MMKNNYFLKKMKYLAIILLAIQPGMLFTDVLGAGDEGNPQQGGTFSGNVQNAPTAKAVYGASQQGSRNAAAAAGVGGKGNKIGGNVNAVDAILNPDKQKKELAAAAEQPPVPQDNDVVREMVMDISINAYPDKCACPYSRNSDGFECGIESAYYKPGGYRIYCYPQDVRGQLNIFYRKTH